MDGLNNVGPASDMVLLGAERSTLGDVARDLLGEAGRTLGTDPEPPAVTGFSPRMFLSPRTLDVMIGVRPGAVQDMASEWDFVVADLVFHEAGGMVTDLAGQRFRYNKPTPHNIGGLIATVDPATHARVAEALRAVRP